MQTFVLRELLMTHAGEIGLYVCKSRRLQERDKLLTLLVFFVYNGICTLVIKRTHWKKQKIKGREKEGEGEEYVSFSFNALLPLLSSGSITPRSTTKCEFIFDEGVPARASLGRGSVLCFDAADSLARYVSR